MWYRKSIGVSGLLTACLSGCGGGTTPSGTVNEGPQPNTPVTTPPPISMPTTFSPSLEFQSTSDFRHNLDALSAISDDSERMRVLDDYWTQLVENRQLPFITEDGVVFLYRDPHIGRFKVDGDWSWFKGTPLWPSNAGTSLTGSKISGTDLWVASTHFPADARLDYKLVADSTYMLDPNNSKVQLSGHGYNSYFSMPSYETSPLKASREGIAKGELSQDQEIYSPTLGYPVNYRVYTPHNPTHTTGLPVIYFVDGQEYLHNEMGAAVTILDNLIADESIPPAFAIFVDPRNTVSGANRRVEQFWREPSPTANFLANELAPQIHTAFETSENRADVGIVGTSLGGMFSSYVCFHHWQTFGLCGIHSPAFPHSQTLDIVNSDALIPAKIALSTGNIGDFLKPSRDFRSALETQEYTLYYSELSQGHSWGNWSDSLGDMLIYLLNNE